VVSISSAYGVLAVALGALAGAGVLLMIVAIRGLPPQPENTGQGRLERNVRAVFGTRGAVALGAGVVTLIATGWVVAGIGVALLVLSWRGLSGAAGERRALARLEGLASWTESLRDTIAGAVGLEQAIPASARVASDSLREPLERLVDRLHTRTPMPEALQRFADDLDDPGADLILSALIINSRLRGPGLRDLLGALATSVREELDMRRKVSADRRATRRSVQIVIGVSVGLALILAVLDRSFLGPYNNALGQLVLVIVVVVYGAGVYWLRKLAIFEAPQRLLRMTPSSDAGPAGEPAGRSAVPQPASLAEPVPAEGGGAR
jgi:Flp pilus assembly protein TadB